MKMLVSSLFAFSSLMALAGPGHHEPVKMPAEFDRMTALVGTWEGTGPAMKPEEKPQQVTVQYALTSGGSAVVETMGPGTPHEMVSIYHAEKGKVAMTHYCMLGNHPTLALKKASAEKMEFEMKGTNGVSSLKEPHMHSLVITFHGPDQITQEWTSFANGKPAESAVFTLNRKKTS